MILVADSSALISLSICDGLYLLDELFEEVKVPLAVFNEVVREEKKESIKLFDYLKNKTMAIELADYFFTDYSLDKGELEAIALYGKLNADKLLIDDKRARKIAIINKINVIGSLGILLLAKQRGLIEEVKPFLGKILNSDIFLAEGIYSYALKLADEE